MSLQQFTNLLSALASTGMFLIWTIYAVLFYREFSRRRGALLYIHEAGGGNSQAHCLLVNLSKEPVHVLCSLAARKGASVRLHDFSDRDDLSLEQSVKQGPLAPGNSLLLGAFDQICRELAITDDEISDETVTVEVRVAAIHGCRTWPVGARRCFHVSADRIAPESFDTEQLQSRRHARQVRDWIEKCRDG